MSASEPLVVARGLVKSFVARAVPGRSPRGRVLAVDRVDVSVREGETLGLVGESGSGKSTLGRLLIRLVEPDAGSVRFDGQDLHTLGAKRLREMRRDFQIVFQDPQAALNPRMTVGSLVAEPLEIHGIGASRTDRRGIVVRLLEEVGLDRTAIDRHPHAFSGGQRQRIGIARAIACRPRFIVCDEPVSALDPPVQAQIVNLMSDLQERHGIAYLFIAHDLGIVRRACDRVAVMYLGRIVEEAPVGAIFAEPLHPYTRALLAASPSMRPGRQTLHVLEGEPPSPSAPPTGCRFHTRCPVAEPRCSSIEPEQRPAGDGRRVSCHLTHPPG